MHANEKTSMEQHYIHQINALLTEKHALSEELQKLQKVGGPPECKVLMLNMFWSDRIGAGEAGDNRRQGFGQQPNANGLASSGAAKVQAPIRNQPQPQPGAADMQSAEGQEGNSHQGMNWIQSLMTGRLSVNSEAGKNEQMNRHTNA
eukprot:scaffold58328_cov39-Prasinocladus_malaysianus.AAC.1